MFSKADFVIMSLLKCLAEEMQHLIDKYMYYFLH